MIAEVVSKVGNKEHRKTVELLTQLIDIVKGQIEAWVEGDAGPFATKPVLQRGIARPEAMIFNSPIGRASPTHNR